jgi:5-methylcytosine-specific restriction enzyme B
MLVIGLIGRVSHGAAAVARLNTNRDRRDSMTAADLEPHLFDELKAALNRGLASGELLTPLQIEQQTTLFRDRFGPTVLRELDGEALLQLMHGRRYSSESKCLAYWLEFKNDDEFAGNQFGGIGGGSALKFGIFQRQSDSAWMTGSPLAQQVLSLEDAVAIARKQRDELVAGAEVLASLHATNTSDEAYAQLQAAMEKAAPELSRDGWPHKYWFLIHPNLLDAYHSPRYQRFHLLKLLQMPPDGVGILDVIRRASSARAVSLPPHGSLVSQSRRLIQF